MKPDMVQRASEIENHRIRQIDGPELTNEIPGQGLLAERFVALFYDGIPGFKTRLATSEEDKGPKNGGHQTVDLVVSFSNGKPAFAVQTTSSVEKRVADKKLEGIMNNPFIRLDSMKLGDLAIPKVLVSLDAGQTKNFFENPNPAQYPELFLKVINDHINSLTFDLSKTQNPLEQKAVSELIEIFKEEKKKYIS